MNKKNCICAKKFFCWLFNWQMVSRVGQWAIRYLAKKNLALVWALQHSGYCNNLVPTKFKNKLSLPCSSSGNVLLNTITVYNADASTQFFISLDQHNSRNLLWRAYGLRIIHSYRYYSSSSSSSCWTISTKYKSKKTIPLYCFDIFIIIICKCIFLPY